MTINSQTSTAEFNNNAVMNGGRLELGGQGGTITQLGNSSINLSGQLALTVPASGVTTSSYNLSSAGSSLSADSVVSRSTINISEGSFEVRNGEFRMDANAITNQSGGSSTVLNAVTRVRNGAIYNLSGGSLQTRAGGTGLTIENANSQFNLSGGTLSLQDQGTDSSMVLIRDDATLNWNSGGIIVSANPDLDIIIQTDSQSGGQIIANDLGSGAGVLDLTRSATSPSGFNKLSVIQSAGSSPGVLQLEALRIDMDDLTDIIPTRAQVQNDPLGLDGVGAGDLADDTLNAAEAARDFGIQGGILLIEANQIDRTNLDIDAIVLENLANLDPTIELLGSVDVAAGETVFEKFGAAQADARIRSFAYAEVTDTGVILRFNVVPEPSSALLLSLGLFSVARLRRRK